MPVNKLIKNIKKNKKPIIALNWIFIILEHISFYLSQKVVKTEIFGNSPKKKERERERNSPPLTCTWDFSNHSTIGSSVVDGAVKPSIESFY